MVMVPGRCKPVSQLAPTILSHVQCVCMCAGLMVSVYIYMYVCVHVTNGWAWDLLCPAVEAIN